MLPLVLLIIGIVAALLEEQVGGQHTVGVVLAAIGGALLIIQMIATAIVGRKVSKMQDDIWSNFR